MSIVIEHDRGTEEQYYFRRRIRGYLIMLRNGGYKELFQVGGITIAFTTSAGVERLKKMREWTLRELADEPRTLGSTFYFTTLTKPISPHDFWVKPSWYTLYDPETRPLLAGGESWKGVKPNL